MAARVDGGNDRVSVNWAAWEHSEIYSMLHTTVDLPDIGDGVHAWCEQGQSMEKVLTSLTPALNRIISDGWRGEAADRAINALEPIDQWSVSVAATTERITALMAAVGSSVGQAKAAVPPPKSFDWGECLRRFTIGGMTSAVNDAVAQERAQSEAHAEAVRIMTNVYSTPINDYSAAVPTYPQLVDPTLQPLSSLRSPVRHRGPVIPMVGFPMAGPAGMAGPARTGAGRCLVLGSARMGAGTLPTRCRPPLRCRV
jgi:hypothetical protein